MYKYRAEITKGEEIRYISHLDYAGLLERAICRAHLPAAYSEGFNPHMKLAFASALAVGVTSAAEYMDFELTEPLCQPEVFDRLSKALPSGVRLLRLKTVEGKHPALMAQVDAADYEILLPLSGDWEKAQKAGRDFLAEREVLYTRITPKKTREIEVRQYVADLQLALQADQKMLLSLKIRITPTGSIKPGEILHLLWERWGLPTVPEKALIHRQALWGKGKNLLDLV